MSDFSSRTKPVGCVCPDRDTILATCPVHSASMRRNVATLPATMTREERWWRSTLRDVVYALRHQDDLSREQIAEVIERSLNDEVPGV